MHNASISDSSLSNSTPPFTESSTDETTSDAPLDDAQVTSIPWEEIELVERLGNDGWNADSFRGQYRGKEVVVKKYDVESFVQEEINFEDLSAQFSRLGMLSHESLVSLLGMSIMNPNFAIVLEPMDMSLYHLLFRNPLESTSAGKSLEKLEDQLQILLDVSNAMGYLHSQGIAMGDLSSHTVLMNIKGGRLLAKVNTSGLIRMSRQIMPDDSPYVSPEVATKRDSIEKPADVFSFAIVMYELLTARHAYSGHDNRGQIHIRVSKDPSLRPSMQGIASVLDPIRQQAFDLMRDCWEHDPTQRPTFQDISVLLADLFEQKKNPLYVSHFASSSRKRHKAVFSIDRSEVFGRDFELAQIKDVFSKLQNPQQLSRANQRCLMIMGSDGVGKTAFVRRLVQILSGSLNKDVFSFCSGKFHNSQNKNSSSSSSNNSNNAPFSAITQAISQIVQARLITPSERNISIMKRYRTIFMKTIGRNGQLVIDFLPQLERIVGPQRAIPDLPPSEARVRFWSCFSTFLEMIATEKHKIVMFLDDVHYCDADSMTMISRLLSNPNIFLILAMRNIKTDHPLSGPLNSLSSITKTYTIALEPLSVRELNKICSKTLRCFSEEQSMPLSQLIYSRTGGNPQLFINYFSFLEKAHFIRFDSIREEWAWDLESIQKNDDKYSDDIVQMLLLNMRNFSPKSRHILQFTSILGDSCDFHLLKTVCARVPINSSTLVGEIALKDLAECTAENVLTVQHRSATGSTPLISFPHAQARQAALQLWADWDKEKPRIQLQIGRILKLVSSEDGSEAPVNGSANTTQLFEIVTRMNDGSDLIENKKEMMELIHLNIKAAQIARKAIAFDRAVSFTRTADRLLFQRIPLLSGSAFKSPSSSSSPSAADAEALVWADNDCYNLALTLSLIAQQLEYAVAKQGDMSAGDRYFEIICKFARRSPNGGDILQVAKATQSRAEHLEVCLKFRDSLALLLSFLEQDYSDPKLRGFSAGLRAANQTSVEEMFRAAKKQLEKFNFEQISKLRAIPPSQAECQIPELLILVKVIATAWIVCSRIELSYIAFEVLNTFLLEPWAHAAEPSSLRLPANILAVISSCLVIVVSIFKDYPMSRSMALALQRQTSLEQNFSALHNWAFASHAQLSPLKSFSSFLLKKVLPMCLAQGYLTFATHTCVVAFQSLYLTGKSFPSILKLLSNVQTQFENAPGIASYPLMTIRVAAGLFRMLVAGPSPEDEKEKSFPMPNLNLLYNLVSSWTFFLLHKYDKALACIQKAVPIVMITTCPTQDIACISMMEAVITGRAATNRISDFTTESVLESLDKRIIPELSACFHQVHAENFGAQYSLACAERARLAGQSSPDDIAALYQTAIDYARRNEFLVLELIAQECLLNYHIDIGSRAAIGSAISVYETSKLLGIGHKIAVMRSDSRFSQAIAIKEEQDQKSMSTMLLNACSTADVRTVKKVLSNSETREMLSMCRDPLDQSTPLHKAAANVTPGAVKVLKLLLSIGAQLNSFDCNRSTPIHYAASNGNARGISVMLRHLQQESPDQTRVLLNSRDVFGYCPLHLALRRDFAIGTSSAFEAAQVLLLFGGDPNLKQTNGDTALLAACDSGAERVAVVEFLLRQPGTTLTTKDRNGDTALIRAARNSHFRVVELLIAAVQQQDCLTDQVDAKGGNLMHIAANNDNFELLKLVHKHTTAEVVVSNPNSSKTSPRRQGTEISGAGSVLTAPLWLKMLCYDRETSQQKTAMQIALECGSHSFLGKTREMIFPLSSNDAKSQPVSAQVRQDILLVVDANGDTMMHTAIQKKNVVFAQWLFHLVGRTGAQRVMSMKNKANKTPADLLKQLDIKFANWN